MIKMLVVGYITFIIGITVSTVGNMPQIPLEPYPWWLPIQMAALLIAPAVLSYCAGLEDGGKL